MFYCVAQSTLPVRTYRTNICVPRSWIDIFDYPSTGTIIREEMIVYVGAVLVQLYGTGTSTGMITEFTLFISLYLRREGPAVLVPYR